MKNYRFFLYVCLPFLLFTCRQPEVDSVDNTKGLVRNVKVDAATNVVFDKETGIVQVTLPESYSEDFVYLDLDMHEGAKLVLNSREPLNVPGRAGFYFKGSAPFDFYVSRDGEPGIGAKSYKVYVEHLGPLGVSLPAEPLIAGMRFSATLKFNSGMGTIPERLGAARSLTAKLISLEDGSIISGKREESESSRILFSDNVPPLWSSYYSLELEYGDQRYTIPGKTRLKRAPLEAIPQGDGSLFFILPKNKEIQLRGGYFTADAPYRIKLESAFQTPVWSNARYEGPYDLYFEVPGSTVDGNYMLRVFERDSLIASMPYTVTNDAKLRGISELWTEDKECPTFGNAMFEKSISKGQKLYASPFRPIADAYPSSFDPNKALPDLELKNGQKSVILKAKTRADKCQAAGLVFVYYGEYTIPADMTAGAYEARLLYLEDVKSVPFWTLITVN